MSFTKETPSSILPEPERLSQYLGGQTKYYYLPLHADGPVADEVASLLGCYNHELRSFDEVTDSLTKAKHGRYSHVKILYDRTNCNLITFTLESCAQLSLPVVLQICVSSLEDESFRTQLMTFSQGCSIEWVLDRSLPEFLSFAKKVQNHFVDSHLSIPIFSSMDWSLIYSPQLFVFFKNIHLYFGYHSLSHPGRLNCTEAHHLVGLLRKRFPDNQFLPPKGVDMWDDRIHNELDLEPYILPCYETKTTSPQVKFSVVIPTFNNEVYVPIVLRHLYRQSVGLDNFEVIIVDDGGNDRTQHFVIELLKSLPEPMNFKYIFFPRSRPRVRGDAQYRAGIARNLGAKNATGEILCFLDSDIVVPKDYLEKVDLALEVWDGVQARRVNLSHKVSRPDLKYDQVQASQDTIADEPYWESFIKMTDWHLLPYNWKYVCTHSFSLKKDLFWKLGGLKKNYIYYGFEDTDLGYRLVKLGYRLHLLDVRVYHLFHQDTHSEFFNIKALRHSLLTKTAQIFYLHHLDEDIFENLLGFMEPETSFQRTLTRFFDLISLKFLWGGRPSVYRSLPPYQSEDA